MSIFSHDDPRSTVIMWIKYVITAVVILALLVLSADILLLAFGGIIVAVLLRSLTQRVEGNLGAPHPVAIILVLFTIIASFTFVGVIFAPSISAQYSQLAQTLPQSLAELESQFGDNALVGQLISRLAEIDVIDLLGQGNVISQVTGAASTVFTILATTFIVAFVGIYGAFEPKLYVRGAVSLFPKPRRDRVLEILNSLRSTLLWWLVGQFSAMAVIGILTTAGLMILDVPLAPLLGLIAALLAFIPNIGPILSYIPAVLLAFLVGPQTALFVTILYGIIQFVESYLVTPLIQRQTIALPPALVLITQILFGVWFGIVGLILAAPLTAILIALIREVYVKDTLGGGVTSSAS